MKIKAFGKNVHRNKAYQIILNDKVCEIVFSHNTESLEDLLMDGWVSLKKWSDEELEEFIGELCIDNQPNGRI